MKKVLLVIISYILGIITVIKLIFSIFKKTSDFFEEEPIVRGVKDFIVCSVSKLLYGRPDILIIRDMKPKYRRYRSSYSDFKRYYSEEDKEEDDGNKEEV